MNESLYLPFVKVITRSPQQLFHFQRRRHHQENAGHAVHLSMGQTSENLDMSIVACRGVLQDIPSKFCDRCYCLHPGMRSRIIVL